MLQTFSSIITAFAAAAAAVVAVLGLNAWKKQLRGKNDYELARRYLRAVYKLRDAVKFVRNPFIPVEEINAALKDSGRERERADREEINRAVYSARWEKVTDAGSDLSVELREAEISWGQEALIVEQDFEKCVQELFVALRMFFQLDQQPDRDLIYDMGEQDTYNKKLREAVAKIENYLAPHLR